MAVYSKGAVQTGGDPGTNEKQNVKAVGPVTEKDQAEVTEGINAAKEAQPIPIKPGKQTFEFASHKFSFNATAGKRLQILDRGESRSFLILGKERPGMGSSVFSVFIIVARAGEELPTKEIILDGMLYPYRQRLVNYAEKEFSLPLANGRTASGLAYSGSYAGEVKTRGFYAVTPVKGALYVMMGMDRDQFYDDSMKDFKELAGSLDISS
jgi:hypothetical protein